MKLYEFVVLGSLIIFILFLVCLIDNEHANADKWRHLAEQAAKNCSESSDRP